MAEGTEKSIQERIEETRMDQAIKIQEETVSSSAVWDCHRAEHDGITEENIKEHVEECLGEMLNNYIEDERNYALDGAVIRCDQMSDKEVLIQFMGNGSKIGIKGGGKTIASEYTKPVGIGPDGEQAYTISAHVGEDKIRKLHAISGNSQTDIGIRFATVIDRSYLREEVEEEQSSIVSCGNCKKIEEKDIKKIAENWDGVCKYGTCYALMQLASNWINPYCMESIAGECKGEDFLLPFSGFDVVGHTLEYATCVIEHHRPIKFSTTEGEKEGLTMMSTLLCGKEGIITIEASGQIYIEPKVEDIEARIEELTSSITGKAVTSVEEIVNLSSVEVLARVIYQEQSYEGERAGQNAVMFSIFNRLFIGNVTRSIKENNHIYSIITASGQYDSIMNDRGNYPNAYQPPSGDSAEWENAKRLAAILYIAMEEYGHNVYDSEANITGSTKDGIILYDRNENVVDIDDLETREAMVDFIEEQCDIDGNKIINEIGTRGNIVTNHGTTPKHSGGKIIGGNEFY